MTIMGDQEATSCTWGQFTHIWADTKLATRNSQTMLEKAFPFFDEDGSGFITRQEMTDQFAELGGLLTAEEIQHFHDILDSDGNGVIDVRLPNCALYGIIRGSMCCDIYTARCTTHNSMVHWQEALLEPGSLHYKKKLSSAELNSKSPPLVAVFGVYRSSASNNARCYLARSQQSSDGVRKAGLQHGTTF